MNDVTHFFWGYLLSVYILGYEYSSYETLLIAIASIIPDYDVIIGFIFPLEHGVATHTILGCTIMTVFHSLGVILYRPDFGFLKTLMFSMIGSLGHLLADVFTYFYSEKTDQIHHMYFWPIWKYPIHLNTLFSFVTFKMRVILEVVFSMFLFAIIFLKGWYLDGKNPFLMFKTHPLLSWFVVTFMLLLNGKKILRGKSLFFNKQSELHVQN